VPFDPLTLSPAIWLKADAITGLVDGDSVITWADSSGNGRDVGQVTAASRPLYKTGIINGLPILRFDGANDYLLGHFAATYLNTVGMTGYAVAIMRQHSGTHEGLYSTTSSLISLDYSSPDAALFGYGGTGNTFTQSYRSSAGAATTIARPLLTPYLLTSGFDGALAYNRLYFSGALQGNVSSGHVATAFAADDLVIGSRKDGGYVYYAFADVAELVLFNSWHSSTDRANMEGYLLDKWGLSPTPRPPSRRLIVPHRSQRLAGGWSR
jgi:hypothetical protein